MTVSAFTYAIQVETESGVWKPLLVRSGQFPEVNQNRGTIDITAHGDPGLPWRSFALGLYDAVDWSVQVMSGGSPDNVAAFSYVRSKLGDPGGVNVRVRNTAGAGTTLFQGNYIVAGLTLSAPLEDVVSYTVRFVLNGAPTTHLGS
jgi:predicted secreted protein